MRTLDIATLVLLSSIIGISSCAGISPPIDQQYDTSEAESNEHDLFDLHAEGSEIKYDIRRLFKPRRPIKDDNMANIIKNRIKEKGLQEETERLNPEVLRNRRRLLKLRQQQRFKPVLNHDSKVEESPGLKKKRISEILSGIVMDRYEVDDLPNEDLVTEADEVAVIPPAVSSEIEGAKATINESEGGANELLDRFVTTYLESTTTTEAPETYTFPSFPKLDTFSSSTTTTTTTTTTTMTTTTTTSTGTSTEATTTATTTTTEATTTRTTPSTTATTTKPATTASVTTSYTTAPTVTDKKAPEDDEDVVEPLGDQYYYEEYYEEEVGDLEPFRAETNNTILVQESIPDRVEVVYPEGSASTEEPPKANDALETEEIPTKYVAPKLPGFDFNDPAVFLNDRQEWEPEPEIKENDEEYGEEIIDADVVTEDDPQDEFVSLEKSLEELEQEDIKMDKIGKLEAIKQVPKFKRKALHHAPPPPQDLRYLGAEEPVEIIDLVGSASKNQDWSSSARVPKSEFPPEQVGTSIVVGHDGLAPNEIQDPTSQRRTKSDLDDAIIKSIEEVLDVKIPVDSKLLYRSASNRFVREGKNYHFDDDQVMQALCIYYVIAIAMITIYSVILRILLMVLRSRMPSPIPSWTSTLD